MNRKLANILNWFICILGIVSIPYYIYVIYTSIISGSIMSSIMGMLFLSLSIVLMWYMWIPFLRQKLPDRHYFTRMKIDKKLSKFLCRVNKHKWVNGTRVLQDKQIKIRTCKNCKLSQEKVDNWSIATERIAGEYYDRWGEPLE